MVCRLLWDIARFTHVLLNADGRIAQHPLEPPYTCTRVQSVEAKGIHVCLTAAAGVCPDGRHRPTPRTLVLTLAKTGDPRSLCVFHRVNLQTHHA